MLRKYGMAGKELTPEQQVYDIIIIGGGIVGAGLFREQALHGVKSLILEQADFNSQTSQGSSKMLHGGIRYLENMDFGLVFEALKEKNLWLKLTPHLTKEIPFHLPVYKESKWPVFFLRIGLFIYDLLSFFKNSPHKIFNKKQCLKRLHGLKQENLKGCGLYYDGVVDDAKLGLECIYDGLNNPNCNALNYKKVTNIQNVADKDYIVSYQDMLTGEQSTASSKFVIFATGPFTDQVMSDLNIPWQPVVLPSKGTHLWIKEDALPIKEAMVLQTKDGRIIFVIPQRNAILVGTTEIPLGKDEKILNIKPSAAEIQYLLTVLNEYFPNANVSEQHIISSFAAVRPLIRSRESSAKTSRHHKIFNPQNNMYVLVGGKYTTFRKMAEDLNKIIFKKMGIKHNPKLTLKTLKTTSIVTNPFNQKVSKEDIEQILKNEHVKTREDLLNRRLSLPNLKHLNDEEITEYIDSLDLKSIREPS